MKQVVKRYEFAGLPIAVENPAGSERSWTGDGGVERKTTMRHDYGFIEGQDGRDGDELDCYVGPTATARFAYVVHQLQRPGYDRPDEDKVFLGFDSEADAKAAFVAHRDDGEQAYGGMSAIPIGDFVRKMQTRTGSGKVRHERTSARMNLVDEMQNLVDAWRARQPVTMDGIDADVVVAPRVELLDIGAVGSVPTKVWDRGATFGEKVKNGRLSIFSVDTFNEFTDNWLKRGERLSLCYNHQSAFVEENGQPAPALAQYDAIAIVAGGKIVRFERLLASTAAAPKIKELEQRVAQLATSLDPKPTPDGMWFYRGLVTDMGQKLLPGFSYISPMFTTTGADENGNPQGYTLIDLAATNTPFQAGCVISFDRASRPPTTRGVGNMAAKLAKMSKFVKFEDGADDKTIKAAVLQKMEDEKVAAMEDEGYKYADSAKCLEDMAKVYEEAHLEEDDKDAEAPHVAMRKLAARMSKMAKMDDGADGAAMSQPPPDDKKDKLEGDEAYERAARPRLIALAQRLGVEVKQGARSQELLDAIGAAAVPAGNMKDIVNAQVERALLERDREQKQGEKKKRADELVAAAKKGNYPEENLEPLRAFAMENLDGASVLVKKFLGVDELPSAQLFSRMTEGGSPIGGEGRNATTAGNPLFGGKDVRVVDNALATFVIEGEQFSRVMKEWAEKKEGPIKDKIDAYLGVEERLAPHMRLYAAHNLLKKERPELYTAQRGELFGI